MPQKKKTNKAKGRKPRLTGAAVKARAIAAYRPQRNPGLEHLAMGVCAVTNPFCPEAIGSRWPDNSYTKSIGWGYQNQNQTVGADANGSGAVLFCPSMYNTVYGGVVTGTSVGYGGSGSPGAPITMGVARFRITSFGLRVNSSLSKMTCSGTAHIRLFSPQTFSSLTTTSLTSTFCDASFDIPLSRLIDEDAFILSAPLGNDAHLFRPVDGSSAAISTQINPGWQFIQVGFTGAPASSVPLNVYMYYHFEVIPEDADSANAFTTAPPRNNPELRNASASVFERVGNFIEGTAQKVDNLMQSKALKYLMAAGATYSAGPHAGMQALAITDRGQRLIRNVD